MKAEFEYSREDVERIVLDQHAIRFPAPTGMAWAVRRRGYRVDEVTIEAVPQFEAVPEAEQETAENPDAEKIGGTDD